ncbi:MAG: hypothetical protein ACOZQL_12140 [Myxococcota bacterium]
MLPFVTSRPLAEALTQPTLEQARSLIADGRPLLAAALLEGKATALQRAGHFEEASMLFAELGRPPLAQVPRRLMREAADTVRFDPRTQYLPLTTPQGNRTFVDTERFEARMETVADVRLRQVEVASRMRAALSTPVDLHDPATAREYFDRFARTHSTKEVAAEFSEYLRAAWAHPGGSAGVEWTDSIPMDQRAARLEALFEGQPVDGAGRKIVDCEGFAYLTERILGGLESRNGPLSVSYASTQAHVVAVVTTSDELFVVNNSTVSSPVRPSPLEALEIVGRAVCGARADIFRIDAKQSASEPGEARTTVATPKLDSVLWSGDAVVGLVDAEVQQAFNEFRQKGAVNAPIRSVREVPGGTMKAEVERRLWLVLIAGAACGVLLFEVRAFGDWWLGQTVFLKDTCHDASTVWEGLTAAYWAIFAALVWTLAWTPALAAPVAQRQRIWALRIASLMIGAKIITLLVPRLVSWISPSQDVLPYLVPDLVTLEPSFVVWAVGAVALLERPRGWRIGLVLAVASTLQVVIGSVVLALSEPALGFPAPQIVAKVLQRFPFWVMQSGLALSLLPLIARAPTRTARLLGWTTVSFGWSLVWLLSARFVDWGSRIDALRATVHVVGPAGTLGGVLVLLSRELGSSEPPRVADEPPHDDGVAQQHQHARR